MRQRTGVLFEQWDGPVLNAKVLTVHHRHQHELPISGIIVLQVSLIMTDKTQF